MIDLDEMLNGTPTFEQVVEFWKEDGDFSDESYLVEAIEKYLLTEEQRVSMFDNRLTVEKMLNGRYVMANREVVYKIYAEWNLKLGFKAFGN
jgi:hypothetical protein